MKVKRVSLKDIARKAGVSPALVSFVLNGKGREYRVGEQTEKQILAIAEELNYQPNMAAKSLRNGRTSVIGVVVPDITNAFFSQIARHIEDHSAKLDYAIFFGSSDEDTAKLDLLVKGLVNKGVDGLIVVPTERSEKVLAAIRGADIPAVLLDRHTPGMNSVSLDNYKAAYTATEHLIASGFRSIGMVAYETALSHMKERIRGYKKAMGDNGLKESVSIGYLKPGNPVGGAYKVVPKMIAAGADAMLFATNTIAVNSLRCVLDAGLSIPGDLGVVSFDGSDAFDFFYSPLTYIKQPIDVLAQKAVEVLVDAITNRNLSVQTVAVEGELVVRASSIRPTR